MSNIYKLVIIVFLSLIIFNKKIITYYYTKKLSKWIERPILYNKISIDYLEIRDEKKLKIITTKKKFRLFVAFWIDRVRLIDNY